LTVITNIIYVRNSARFCTARSLQL
jgi:hypothetical protein